MRACQNVRISLLIKGQLHIAGDAMDIPHGSIYGNW